ncbi:MAG: condensation domain-containing protein, partial [Bacteroidota bacterium]
SHPVLADQSQYISGKKGEVHVEIPRVKEQAHYASSHGQKRLWVLDQLEEVKGAYHISSAYQLRGSLDRSAFEESFDRLVHRHESLRTNFEMEGEVLRQKIRPYVAGDFKVGYADFRGRSSAALGAYLEKLEGEAFDLSEDWLLRAILIEVAASEYVFVFTMHHIISDGWSMDVLFQDFLHYYTSYKVGEEPSLQPLAIQYKDYAAWQNAALLSTEMASHRLYWLDRFSGEIPVLALPTDRPRPAVQTFHGRTYEFEIPEGLSTKLKSLCQQEGGTLFMGLLASVKVLLYRYTGQEDLVIGSPVAGRAHSDLEGQIGFYVNTLALRTQFSGEVDFISLLRQVKEETLEGYAHQSYPFDRLVEELDLRRDLSRSALFDVMVVLQNTNLPEGSSGELVDMEVSAYPYEQTASQFDLSFAFEEHSDGGLEASITYNTDLFEASTIDR